MLSVFQKDVEKHKNNTSNKANNNKREHAMDVVATKQFEMWYFGLLVLQLCMKDAPTLWQATQADNILKQADMHTLAYGWEPHKLQAIGQLIQSDTEWTAAADLALWCLQDNPARRPQSMEQVLAHRFFNQDGQLHCFESEMETIDAFIR